MRAAALLVLPAALAACAAGPTLAVPRRVQATPGSTLVAQWTGLSLAAREQAMLGQFEAGNVPSFLGQLVPVRLAARIGGRERTATVWCTPDWFGFGTDADWLRAPMTPQLAQRLADRLDCVLPTPRLVDAIWAQAAIKVEPHPFHPREHDIVSVPVFAASHAAIEAQRAAAPRTALLSGGKKDVVLSTLLRDAPDRVVIYGWHRRDGRPIQPRWKGHTTGHVDYSHGIRFVARRMTLDGQPTTVDEVLADPDLHVLLSDEGRLVPARHPAVPPAR